MKEIWCGHYLIIWNKQKYIITSTESNYINWKEGYVFFFFFVFFFYLHIAWSCGIFVQSFMEKTETVLNLQSGHEIYCHLNFDIKVWHWPLFDRIAWFMSSAHRLSMANSCAKFQSILQSMKELWSGYEKLKDRRTWRHNTTRLSGGV